jgi:transcriptional regulator with XRE-family HTH domain
LTGIPQTTISAIESGRVRLDVERALKCLSVLNIALRESA